ncbi:hypothetical protein VJ923_08960 [Adlercreutzia sp. R25]|uniref:hypothetical protein n=1 Tax=Adlercreutzia shanghongiae TaxID=3111773 RepID=UPI002DB83658|nr:hypothetical protein [Adlercreutzia sp. R25]MEC4273285.1 hypothetical protein [Adlercreutzia sp. R25]
MNSNSSMAESRRNPRFILCALVVSASYALLTYLIDAHIAANAHSDLYSHASLVPDVLLSDGLAFFWRRVPYFGFHLLMAAGMSVGLSMSTAAAVACALFNGLAAFVAFYVVSRFLGRWGKAKISLIAIITLVCLFVTAAYLPWFNGDIYIGQGSPTVWHNPTYLAVKPVVLLAVYWFFGCLEEGAPTKEFALFAFAMLISLLLKPSFFQVMLPAALLFAAIEGLMGKKYLPWGKMALAFAPAVIYAGLQAATLFFLPPVEGSNNGGGVGLVLFSGWSSYSPNAGVSILLLLAFPLFGLIACWKNAGEKKRDLLFLGVMLAVGLLEILLLAEKGARAGHGNFDWGLYCAVFASWVYLLPLFVRQSFKDKVLSKPLVSVGLILVAWHFASGLLYAWRMLSTSALY